MPRSWQECVDPGDCQGTPPLDPANDVALKMCSSMCIKPRCHASGAWTCPLHPDKVLLHFSSYGISHATSTCWFIPAFLYHHHCILQYEDL